MPRRPRLRAKLSPLHEPPRMTASGFAGERLASHPPRLSAARRKSALAPFMSPSIVPDTGAVEWIGRRLEKVAVDGRPDRSYTMLVLRAGFRCPPRCPRGSE